MSERRFAAAGRKQLLIGTHLKPPADGRYKLQGETQPRRLSPWRIEQANTPIVVGRDRSPGGLYVPDDRRQRMGRVRRRGRSTKKG